MNLKKKKILFNKVVKIFRSHVKEFKDCMNSGCSGCKYHNIGSKWRDHCPGGILTKNNIRTIWINNHKVKVYIDYSEKLALDIDFFDIIKLINLEKL
jgi:hypothetical protein